MEFSLPRSSQKFLKRKESVMPPSYFHKEFPSFEALKAILELPAIVRTREHVETLVTFSKHLKVFEDISGGICSEAHYQCCQHLTYACCHRGKVILTQFLFHQGDEGSKFYVILSGSCSVLSKDDPDIPTSEVRQLTILRQGDSFGELALISRMPRAASVLCREDCHFAALERDDYTRILSKIQDKKLQDKVELLTRHPVFAKLTKSVVQRLSYFFKVKNYTRKQVVFVANSTVNAVYLIKRGDFQLSKDVQIDICPGKTARSQIDVTVVSAGEILGGRGAIEGGKFEYTATCASTQGEVMFIDKEDFTRTMVSEETTEYLFTITEDKERYRRERLKAAIEVEQSKRQVSLSARPSKDMLESSRSISLRQDLIRGRVSNEVAKFTALLKPPTNKKSDRTDSLNLWSSPSVSMSASSGEEKSKLFHQPSKSWSDIVIHKYAICRPTGKLCLRTGLDSSQTIKRKGTLMPLQIHSGGFDHWRSSVFAMDKAFKSTRNRPPMSSK